MSFLKEFKDFAIKGNALELAAALIIGTAFNKIVSSLVEDIIMPPIGYLIGRGSFSELQVTLSEGVAIRYGAFTQTIIDFLLIALSVFVIIKVFAKLTKARKNNT